MSNIRIINDTSRKLRVFLCHSTGDKPTVRNLYHRLRTDEVEAWLDEEDLVPGQDWELEILRAVRAADIVIVCLSKGSVTKAGFIQKEIRLALDVADMQPDGTIFLIPLRLEECEVPERLRRWQWVDLFEEQGYTRLVKALSIRFKQIGGSSLIISKIEQSTPANLDDVETIAQEAGSTRTRVQSVVDSGLAEMRKAAETDVVLDLLERWGNGDKEARNELFTREYPQLKLIAKMRMESDWEREGLQPEDILHELYIKLLSLEPIKWESREHFLTFASRMIRNILIDWARRKYRTKRGAGSIVEEKEAKEIVSFSSEDLIDLEEALRLLEKVAPRAGQVVTLNLYGGLSLSEIAESLEISLGTAARDLNFAKSWLATQLR